MRRMYGNERHISVLKAELENYIEQDEEDIVKATLMYTKTTHGRSMKDRPHFRPIQNDRIKKNETLSVKPLENIEIKPNLTETSTKIEISNETVNDDKGMTYKTKLESIANIEINHLDPDVITLDAVIKQSIETNSIYPKSSDIKIEALSNNATDKNFTVSTENTNATEPTSDVYDSTTESDKEAFKNSDSSTLPPTLLFSEKKKVDRVDTKVNEKKEEFYQKPNHQHQDSQRPSMIKLGGA